MVIVVRYACLLAVGIAAIFAFVSAAAVTGQMLLAGAGSSVQNPGEMSLWVMVCMGGLGLLSLARYTFVRLPTMARDWYRENREQLATIVVLGGVFLAFVML
ncbi:MAG: hypothetical protein VX871_00345 [Pseudomonadota bacterium]|nr:hypothetical protein [Pseudomonadota bacterium]